MLVLGSGVACNWTDTAKNGTVLSVSACIAFRFFASSDFQANKTPPDPEATRRLGKRCETDFRVPRSKSVCALSSRALALLACNVLQRLTRSTRVTGCEIGEASRQGFECHGSRAPYRLSKLFG